MSHSSSHNILDPDPALAETLPRPALVRERVPQRLRHLRPAHEHDIRPIPGLSGNLELKLRQRAVGPDRALAQRDFYGLVHAFC